MAKMEATQNRDSACDAELLKILCCPETRQSLSCASPGLLEKLNGQITAGTLRSRDGQTVREKIDGGLARADGRLLYPVRQRIPVMIVGEAIALGEG